MWFYDIYRDGITSRKKAAYNYARVDRTVCPIGYLVVEPVSCDVEKKPHMIVVGSDWYVMRVDRGASRNAVRWLRAQCLNTRHDTTQSTIIASPATAGCMCAASGAYITVATLNYKCTTDSAMSESSSELGSGGRKRTTAQLVDRLRFKASTERLSLLSHLSIGRTLCRLRDALANGEEVSRKTAMALLCCGISLYRRYTLGDREEDEEDSEETNALIKQSAVLIFVLLAAIEASRGDLVDLKAVCGVVATANASTLARVLHVNIRKRKACGEQSSLLVTGEDGEAGAEEERWAEAVTVSSGELTMCVLKFVSHSIGESAAVDHELLADLFFRNSAACMAHKILLDGGTKDFVCLRATATNPIPRDQRLLAIAQAGESEAGQSCLRDFLLSFLLPCSVLGVRRTLLMSRSASTAAGIDYAAAVNTGHSVAYAKCYRTTHITIQFLSFQIACAGWRGPNIYGSTLPIHSSARVRCLRASPCSRRVVEMTQFGRRTPSWVA